MQSQNIHKKLIDRVRSKINKISQEPNISLKPLSSFANDVYKVEVGQNDHQLIRNKCFLLKFFRAYLSQFSSKVVENQIVTSLSKLDLYPTVHYSDNDCRIQDFLVGYAPSTDNVTQQQMLVIMQRLGKLVTTFQNYSDSKDSNFRNKRQIGYMFTIYEKVADQCKEKFPDSYQICKKYVEQILQLQIRTKLKQIVPKQMVPTHNDCHFHNVIITNKDHKLYLIDFQFFSLNYRGFELGNFFNEYATDYHTFQIKQELQLPEHTKRQLISHYYSLIGSQLSSQECWRQVQVGRLLSHLFWLFIGVKQVKDPKITIDMQYYIKRRYEEFMKIYQALVALKK